MTKMLFLQLLLLMFLLAITGEPLRVFLSRFFNPFKNLDVLQACVINVYLAGLIFYVIALLPLHLFTMFTAWGITISLVLFYIVLHQNLLKKLKNWLENSQKWRSVHEYLNKNKIVVLKEFIVSGMFILSLWIQLTPPSNFVFGSINDTSLHSLFVELILENGQIPSTHQPYLPAAVIYPQGAHVMFAYSCYIFGMLPAKAVLYLSPLFSAMTILAAYHFGKEIHHSRNLDVIFAFVIALVSMWPAYITWGSNPFILGFPLYLICLSFFPLLHSSLKSDKFKELFVTGVLYGYLASIHIAFYEVIIASAMLWLAVKSFHKPKKMHTAANFLLMCTFSIFPIAPFLYRFIIYYPYPGHNIGLPSDIVADVTSPPTTHGQPFQSPIISILKDFPAWILLNYNVQPNLVLRIIWACLAFASFFALYLTFRKKREIFTVEKIALITFSASILLDFCTYVLPEIPWSRVSLVLYVSLCMLISAFTIRLYFINSKRFTGFLRKRKVIGKNKKKAVIASLTVNLLFFSVLYGPFVYYKILNTPRDLKGLYGIYAVTSKSDYELMMWMRYGLPDNVTILVNPCDSGGFITSVSQKKVVFPFSAYLLSHSYRRLIDLIRQGITNKTTYELIKSFGITHIFLGSRTIKYWGNMKLEENQKWDPLLFLGNPNFELVKNVGNSYLFQVSPNLNPSMIFQDDFEHLNLTQMKWEFNQVGRGEYNISIHCDITGNHFLNLTTKKDLASRWLYAAWLNRKIYLPDTSNVSLSFDLNASNVSPPDTVMISIFDSNYSHRLGFVTPSPIYDTNSDVIELQSSCGSFNFDIGQIWMERFNETLPRAIILEFALVNVNNNSFPSMSVDNVTLTTG